MKPHSHVKKGFTEDARRKREEGLFEIRKNKVEDLLEKRRRNFAGDGPEEPQEVILKYVSF